MSSLQATQADGYYLPPAYYESQNGKKRPLSKNQWFASQHHGNKKTTTAAAAAHNQFAARGVVRFELPYNALCLHCHAFCSRGTRFNAHKTKTGDMYFTTPIYEFVMTCRACGVQQFTCRTNPAARGFDYVSGLQRIDKRNSDDHNKTTVADAEETELSELEVLEAREQCRVAALSEHDELKALQSLNDRTYRNDSDGNAMLRAKNRIQRTQRKRRRQEEAAMGWKRTGMRLVDESIEDQQSAQETTFGDCRQREINNMKRVRQASIFDNSKTRARSSNKEQKVALLNNNRNGEDHHGASSPKPDRVPSMNSKPHQRRQQRHVATVDLTLESAASLSPEKKQKKTIRRIIVPPTSSGVIASAPALARASDQKVVPCTSALAALADYSSDSD